MLRQSLVCFLLISSVFAVKFQYPEVKRDESIQDDYYGMKVKDPYRWLEDPDSEDVKKFIVAQNKVTDDYINQPIVKSGRSSPARDEIHKTLTEAYSYPKHRVPERHGNRYFFFKNTGLQNQDVFYFQDTLQAEPRVFFDPNLLSTDGTVAVSDFSFSEDGELTAYGLSSKGSDWVTIRVKNVTSGQDYPEVIEQVKFSNYEWTSDNQGFFYARYPQGKKARSAGTETDKVSNQKIYYHKIGTSQAEDVMVVEFPEHPSWIIGDMKVTRGGKHLLIFPSAGASGENLVYYVNLVEPLRSGMKSKLTVVPVVSKFEAEYQYVTNDDAVIYFITNKDAPNYKLVGIDLNKPESTYWSTLIPESSKLVLKWASPVNQDKLVVGYIEDVKSKLELRFLGNGSLIQNFPLEIGTVNSFSGKRRYDDFFFGFVSFLTPGKVYHVDLTKQPIQAQVYHEVKAPGVDPAQFVTKQVFYPSKDGTQVPMYIVHKKDYVPQSNSPTYLYAYGGFNINILPSFSPERLVFVKHFDGVYAVANIRGGGEYGQKWHSGGRLLNKQNSFDDFQAAAEYLIKEKYTAASKIVINGGSNGGLLVGACVNQRPELYGAAVAQVGVHDLLRFQKFTIGYAWCSEYGCSDDGNKTHFDNLYKLSPLHNVRTPKEEKVQYPAVLLLTGDHDDRVVPLHSYKLAAELQQTVGKSAKQTNPLLLKVFTAAGHGAGKPTTARISEYADILAFLVKSVGYSFTV